MFSVVDGILLRPLPYPASSRIVAVWETYPHWRGDPVLAPLWDRISLSWPDFERWRDGQSSFEEVAAWTWAPRTWTGRAGAERVLVGASTSSLFALLGAYPTVGRLFTSAEQGRDASSMAVVSHDFWQDRLGGDPGVVGSEMMIDGRSYSVVGVLAPAFLAPPARRDGSSAKIWLPVGADGASLEADNHSLRALGRLRPDASIESAQEEALALLRGGAPSGERGARVAGLRDELVADAREPLLLLLAAGGLLLLLACGNVAALLVADSASRFREMATRAALGATRRQLLAQLLAEGLLLGCAAAAAGVGAAAAATRALVAVAPPELPLVDLVKLDGRALALALAAGLATGIVFALAPAAGLLRRHASPGGTMTSRGSSARLQFLVAVGEVAFCTLMLVAATLIAKSYARLAGTDPGFRSSEVIALDVVLPEARYPRAADIAAWHDAVTQAIDATAGVAFAAVGTSVPFAGGDTYGAFEPEGRAESARPAQARYSAVSAGYFEALEIPVLGGRAFTQADGSESDVVVVSRELAARVWPNRSPIGMRIEFQNRLRTVVGVVDDVRHLALWEDPDPELYLPLAADATGSGRYATVLVKSSLDPETIARTAGTVIRDIDANVAVTRIATMDVRLRESTASFRYRALLMSAFTGVAMLLAAIGIAGVSVRAVAARHREIGVRIAAGAAPADVLRLVTARTLKGSALGAVLGVAGAALALGAFSVLLYGIGPLDPFSYAFAAAASILLALAASLVPAGRVLRLDPTVVLRPD